MALYINGISAISPQATFDNSVFLPEVKEYSANKMYVVDTDYSKFFDAVSIRRMSRLVKFGSAAGLQALKDAGIKVPGAISTGTGYGLIEVSQKFLTSVIESNETIVSPTAFIQSTHNTISSNIALLCGCHAHNNTFSHKGFSFESALTDAFLLAKENVDNILVGAYDEVSDYRYDYMKYIGELRNEPCSNLDIYGEKSNGIIFGEGASFFVLAQQKSDNTYGRFIGNKTFYKPKDTEEIRNHILSFLKENNIALAEIDVVISGISGDKDADQPKREFNDTLFSAQTIVAYKHLCGEHMTSSAFAFWLASKIMKTQQIPDAVILQDRNRQAQNILLYNSHKGNHSLMLFKAC
jgi:3-oxoacyl-[acyl-carrier-protein] synthase II